MRTIVTGAMIMLATAAGCATRAARPALTETGAVLAYTPGSWRESWDQRRLVRADARARATVVKRRQTAERLMGELRRQRALLDEEECPPGATPPTREEMRALYEEVKNAWYEWRAAIDEQIARGNAFKEKYPRNWYARHRLAWFLADHVLWPQAAEEWRAVIKMAPRFPYAYNNLGTLYNHMGRDMEAVDLFIKAIELKDDDPMFHVNLAANYAMHRSDVAQKFGWDLPRVFAECIKAHQRARALRPRDKEIAHDIARQYVLAKHFGIKDASDDALAAWNDYLALDLTPRERAIACRDVGRIYLNEKGDCATAVAWFARAVALGDDAVSKMLMQHAKDRLAAPKK